MDLLLLLLVPTLVAAAPLLTLLGVTQLRVVQRSVALTAVTTLAVSLMGVAYTVLSILCAVSLLQRPPAQQPGCLTGVGVFVPIGGLFTVLTLATGTGLTIRRALRKPPTREAPRPPYFFLY